KPSRTPGLLGVRRANGGRKWVPPRCSPRRVRAELAQSYHCRHVFRGIAMAELSTRSIEAARNEVVVVAAPQQQVSPRTWAALAILCLGAFLVVLDTTIVNIAIPSIMTGLHSSL